MSKKDKAVKGRVNRQRRTVLQGTLAGAAAVGLLRPEDVAADQPVKLPRPSVRASRDQAMPAGPRSTTVKGYISPLYAIEFEIEKPVETARANSRKRR